MSELSIPEDLSIPAFLKIDAPTRKKAWEGRPVTNSHFIDDAWRAIEVERRAAIEAERKEKNARGRAIMAMKHPGEVYDRKTKTWNPA